MSKDPQAQTETKHGPETVSYANGWDGYKPFLQCLCGWSAREADWECVGQEFDQHLRELVQP